MLACESERRHFELCNEKLETQTRNEFGVIVSE